MQRALKTVRYLRELGWQPKVLTVSPRAYAKTTDGQLAEIPADVPVHRAFGLETTRHFAFRGRYIGAMSWPDPWVSWWPHAVWTGRRMLREYRPSAIWSTFPICTAKMIALSLAKTSGLPWVADFRDPMSMEGYPADPWRFKWARKIEAATIARASRVVFTAEYTRKMYRKRYPSLGERALLIPNGFDDANFPTVASTGDPKDPERRLHIVHSGAMQPEGRNPEAFFSALAELKQDGVVDSGNLRITLRACSYPHLYEPLTERYGVSDIVEFGDYLPYDDAIREMVSADGLLLFQGTVYNHAVPAKLYEYLNAQAPVFGLVDSRGETASVLKSLRINDVADIASKDEIVANFRHYVTSVRNGNVQPPSGDELLRFSRREQVKTLSGIIEGLIGP
ncbi:MAG: glycosyltransferase [Pseudomonadota bacterium]